MDQHRRYPRNARFIIQPIDDFSGGGGTSQLELSSGKVYCLLLNNDLKHPLSKMIADHWSDLHYMTGDDIVIGVLQTPRRWPKDIKNYWRERLGDVFDEVWKQWHETNPAVAFKYADYFKELNIKPSQLPCMVLFTAFQSGNAVMRQLPLWTEDELYLLMQHIIETMKGCANYAEDGERLDCLQRWLTSPSTAVQFKLGNLQQRAFRYFEQHPAKVITVGLGTLAAFANAGILPIGAAAIEFINAIRDAIKLG